MRSLTKIQWMLIVLVLIVSLIGSWLITGAGWPDGCPDEPGRQKLTNFIYENNRLPIGNEPEIILGTYGFSYALRPYLTAVIGTAFMKITAIFSTSVHAMLFASRLCSVLSITLCALFCFMLGNRLFSKTTSSTLFGILICFLPQVLFLGMYQNNDSFSLVATVAVLYFFVSGHQEHWKTTDCVWFAVATAVCLLSYYSVYGWLLVCGVSFFYSMFSSSLSLRQKLIKCGIIAGIIFLLAGWFFIRNAVLNQGDFFGIATEDRWREELTEQGVDIFQYNTPSQKMSFFQMLGDNNWFRLTTRSFIGYFGYMNIPLDEGIYYVYYTLFGIGILLFVSVSIRSRKTREEKGLFLMMLVASLITIGLSAYQSYVRDYQPQGRYIITLMILFAYMITYSCDRIKIMVDGKTCVGGRIRIDIALMVIWLGMFVKVLFGTLSKMFV